MDIRKSYPSIRGNQGIYLGCVKMDTVRNSLKLLKQKMDKNQDYRLLNDVSMSTSPLFNLKQKPPH